MCNNSMTTTGHESAAARRGALIVLEGLDRSGKSTQAVKLYDYLASKGNAVRIQRFPDREEPRLGPIIDEFLRSAKSVNDTPEFIHLLFSANRWAVAETIRREIANGMTIIVDRYSYSGITYSLAKGLELGWTAQPEVGLPRPDLVLFFDVDPEKTANREGFGGEILERSDFQKLVYDNMQKIFNDKYWKRINAADSIDNVHADVVKQVDVVLQSVQQPLQSLTSADFDFGR